MNRRTLAARTAASVILAGALLASTSGCTFLSQQATLIHYDPSDGVGLTLDGVDLRNMILLVNDKGDLSSLLVTFINNGDKPVAINLQFTSGGKKSSGTIQVMGQSTASFGNSTDEQQITIEKPDAKAGDLFPLYVQIGDQPGKQVLVPVLLGSWSQYSTLVPTATPTPTEVPTPTETPTPAP
ncbi:MAG: hypothetical protein ABJA94_05380 [Rhodoglobus sp.]